MVAVLGGYQTDFARNLTRAGGEVSDLVAEVVEGTLAAAGTGPGEVGVIHVGNAFGQLFTGQGHLGAMPATVCDELWGVPASRHEAACASGGVALLAAMADLESGRYDLALVLGVEIERTVSGDQAARHLGAAAWVGHEGAGATYLWPHMFGELAEEYDRRYGLDGAHLNAIAELNLRNARANPNAQTRAWTFPAAGFTDDDTANPVVEGRVRRQHCSQVTDGAAGVVLASYRWLREHRRPGISRVLGWGHRTVGLPLAAKLARSADEPYVLPHVRQAILDSFGRAGVSDVDDLDGIEAHDCFAMSQYAAIDHFGITEPGKSFTAVENGDLEIGGRIPVNPSGGLIGGGHPVGASGVRMVLDAHKQVTGTAGAYQVDGANRFGTLNIGGSTATTVAFVLGGAN
ncbi:acetyl-CoA acetyltransferase [Actinokineospora sp. NBRC 105648]|uniref:acetyl-CoA acetyltransferase n=1 Tax=Actinokineospora sp. NBRC 105648 TaxID=3032206 RepID=UPI00249FCDD1|nr:acetyl-CoA acetyltransferase [Actinokineospora sp. NBRC 105648]GLZ38697.1 acetyl-CoA acetyltransferase [Actinokineospora sp. NBRC 105648]